MNNKVKSVFETTNEPSIWSTDKELKRKHTAIKAAATELKNRGLKARHDFTIYSKARPSNGSN